MQGTSASSSDSPLSPELENALARIWFGDPVSRDSAIKAILAQHPQFRAAIQRRVSELQSLERSDVPESSIPAVKGPWADPSSIGPYTILGMLGSGSFGDVYLGELPSTGFLVAIKLLNSGVRYREELASLSILRHDNIARFNSHGDHEGRLWIALEYVEGTRPLLGDIPSRDRGSGATLPGCASTLREFCDEHGLSARARLELFDQVCRGVAHAHLHTVIHRDLKPANILVAFPDGQPTPKIIDFGLAKLVRDPENEGILGSPYYMSPEQARGDPDVDSRTDVYSLGAILHELLVGWPPKAAGNKSFSKSQGVRPADVTSDLHNICDRALKDDREARYGTIDALREDIQRYLACRPVSATSPTMLYRFAKWTARNRLLVGAGLLLVAIAVPLAIVTVFSSITSRIESSRRQEADAVLEVIRRRIDATPGSKEGIEAILPGIFDELAAARTWIWWTCTYADGLSVHNNFRKYRSKDEVATYFNGRSDQPDADAFFIRDGHHVQVMYDQNGAAEMVRQHGDIKSIERSPFPPGS